jgi:PPE-repeat protein
MLFGMLPPEVNSALMYAGAGSGPMMGAVTAWDGLAADLYSTAASCQSVISGLTDGPWQGPSAVRMAAAAAPYVTWLNTTAAQAEWAAGQAKLAAGAFETAHTMTVPPVVVTANRALLMSLIATNFFGQNTPAIAATEAQYTEMWAQDALAMYGYAATAAQAAVLPSFTPPPPTTAGPGAQLAALAQSIGSTGARTLATLSQLTAATPDILQAVSSGSSGLIGQLAGPQLSYGAGLVNGEILILVPQLGIQAAQASAHQAAVAAASSGPILHAVKPFLDAGFGPVISRLATPPMVSVGLGRANMIGPLSVPPSWAGPGAALGRAAPILPNATVSAPSAWTDGPFGQSLLGNMAGQGMRSIASQIPNVKPVAPAHR